MSEKHSIKASVSVESTTPVDVHIQSAPVGSPAWVIQQQDAAASLPTPHTAAGNIQQAMSNEFGDQDEPDGIGTEPSGDK